MNPIHRFLFSLPFALPWLGLATVLDIMLAPISHKLDRDYPQEAAREAWKILGV